MCSTWIQYSSSWAIFCSGFYWTTSSSWHYKWVISKYNCRIGFYDVIWEVLVAFTAVWISQVQKALSSFCQQEISCEVISSCFSFRSHLLKVFAYQWWIKRSIVLTEGCILKIGCFIINEDHHNLRTVHWSRLPLPSLIVSLYTEFMLPLLALSIMLSVTDHCVFSVDHIPWNVKVNLQSIHVLLCRSMFTCS